jgi:23S rRNA (adenine2503-C2)-methyltransferase
MRYKHGNTLCISSQVGCRMGCLFCASTIGGKVRDLLPSEMLGQVIAAARDSGERVSNIVLMGIGEPLDNYDNVLKFLRLVNCENGICIGYRHISLSTSGIVPKILALAEEDIPLTLSVSLHAPTDAQRNEIMPINRRYPLEKLFAACRDYYRKTGRRISFEYTLIAGKNDSPDAAARLASLLNAHLRDRNGASMPIHVNLIPVNPVDETGFSASSKDAIAKFASVLEKRGIRATVRRRLGADINASCGQLRRAEEAKKESDS